MRRTTSLGLAVVTSLALAAPVLSGAATAAPAGRTSVSVPAGAAADQAHKPKKPKKGKKAKLKLSSTAPGVQPGAAGAVVTASKVATKKKVKFTLNGAPLGTVKSKKGKASIALPVLGTGTYVVGATSGKAKGSFSYRVYQSALTLSATSFTLSQKQDATTYAPLTGNVVFKDAVPAGGFVDVYPLGSKIGLDRTVATTNVGKDSPQTLPAGQFTFVTPGGTTNSLLFKIRDNPPGVYQYTAAYTVKPFDLDYIASQVITVTITP